MNFFLHTRKPRLREIAWHRWDWTPSILILNRVSCPYPSVAIWQDSHCGWRRVQTKQREDLGHMPFNRPVARFPGTVMLWLQGFSCYCDLHVLNQYHKHQLFWKKKTQHINNFKRVRGGRWCIGSSFYNFCLFISIFIRQVNLVFLASLWYQVLWNIPPVSCLLFLSCLRMDRDG